MNSDSQEAIEINLCHDDHFFESFAKAIFEINKSAPSTHHRHVVPSGEAQIENDPHHELCSVGLRKSFHLDKRELELLYEEVLYTIIHKVGSQAANHKQQMKELYRYSQESFGISHDVQERIMEKASLNKAPIVILNLTVVEAKNLEAKDSDGFSDPYCMVGIAPGSQLNNLSVSPNSSSCSSPRDFSSKNGASLFFSSSSPNEDSPISPTFKMRSDSAKSPARASSKVDQKDKSPHPFRKFGQSLRRKVGSEKSNSSKHSQSSPVEKSVLKENIPAKYIQTTTYKENTLNPVWSEKFRFDLDDVSSDKLHLDIWDHDDETNVFDAVSRLNQIKGVRGLGRYFKQVGQSARTSTGADVDDFLGSLTISLNNIPSTGLDKWFKLEGRTARSKVQGEIHLIMNLATREDRGVSEESNWTDVRQHSDLVTVFARYEISKSGVPAHDWAGRLSVEAETILHQHAIQGDITSVQMAMCRWIALSRLHLEYGLSYDLLMHVLERLDTMWQPGSLSRDELEQLQESFSNFIEFSLHLVQQVRKVFPANSQWSIDRLGRLVSCLSFIHKMKLFRYSNPFSKEFYSQLIDSLKRSADDTYEWICNSIRRNTAGNESKSNDSKSLPDVLHILKSLNEDLCLSDHVYTAPFEKNANINFLYVTYRRFNKIVQKDLMESNVFSDIKVKYDATEEDFSSSHYLDMYITLFELYAALQKFYRYRDNFSTMDIANLSVRECHVWFRPVIDTWINFAKYRLLVKIESAIEQDEMKRPKSEKIVCTASGTITANCINIIVDVWKKLQWPDIAGRLPYITTITQMLCECILAYSDCMSEKLRLSGYYDEKGQFDIAEELCLALNNIDHLGHVLARLPNQLEFERVAEEVGRSSGEEEAGKLVLKSLTHIHSDGCGSVVAVLQSIIQRVASKMRPEIRKNVFHLCWSPDSVPVEQALSDLITYLDNNLATLRHYLLNSTFCCVLESIWSECLHEFLEQANKEMCEQAEAPSESQSEVIFQRLHRSLLILRDFFHADNKGLPMDKLDSEEYKRVKYLLELQKGTTTHIVEQYFIEKISQQETMKESPYGYLSMRAVYKRDSGTLVVEVINAKALLPLDSNGLSDPYVKVDLVPPHNFNNAKTFRTKVVKNNLNPEFNEHFEFSISLEQARRKGAALCFILMDHDTLVSDDYEGEVFLPLKNIPGVYNEVTGYGALKTVTLPIIQPKYQEDKALCVLSQRAGDHYAQEILKKWMPLEKLALEHQPGHTA